MPVKFTIQENILNVPPTFKGVVISSTTYNKENLIRDIVLAGSTLTEADIHAVVTNLIKVIFNRLVDGGRINLEGLVQIYPSMEGIFTDVTDDFDPSRHRLNLVAKVSERLKDCFRNQVTIEKELKPLPVPTIIEVVDIYTSMVNKIISSGRIINIVGDKLKFDSDRPDEGIYYVNNQTGNEVKQPENTISSATDSRIVFQVTTVGTEGDACHLEVRSRMSNSARFSLKVASSVTLVLAP